MRKPRPLLLSCSILPSSAAVEVLKWNYWIGILRVAACVTSRPLHTKHVSHRISITRRAHPRYSHTCICNSACHQQPTQGQSPIQDVFRASSRIGRRWFGGKHHDILLTLTLQIINALHVLIIHPSRCISLRSSCFLPEALSPSFPGQWWQKVSMESSC